MKRDHANTKGREAKKTEGVFLPAHIERDSFKKRDYVVRLCDDGAWDEVAKIHPAVAKELEKHRNGALFPNAIIMHCDSHAMAVEYYCFHHLASRLWHKEVVSVNMEPSKAKCFIVTPIMPEGVPRLSMVCAIGKHRSVYHYIGRSSAQEYEAGVFCG